MTPTRLGLCVLLALMLVPESLILAQAPSAKPGPDLAVARLTKVRGFRETALAPDGKRVAWVEVLRGKDGTTSPQSAIFVADVGAVESKAQRITAGNGP